mgnify:CR=1 FL=1
MIVRLLRRITLLVALVALAMACPRAAEAQIAGMPPEVERVGVKEHLDEPLPMDAEFRDHTGKHVKLGDYFDGKRPVVLTFAYHTCPVLCGMILNHAAAGLKQIPWTIGAEYDVVTISIDPNESLEATANKRKSILAEYGRSDRGWHFLVGDAKNVARAMQAAGFEAQYDEDQKQWAHPSLIMLAKPDGRLARYLYGLEFPPNDLRIGLLEASEGRSISTVEQLILYCYHYDPKGGKYVLVAWRVMRLGGALVAFLLVGGLALLWRRELKKKPRATTAEDAGSPALVPALADGPIDDLPSRSAPVERRSAEVHED